MRKREKKAEKGDVTFVKTKKDRKKIKNVSKQAKTVNETVYG